ncbi:MAG: lipid II flippase MurJ, partial [Actinoplanes sp.]
QIPLYGLVATAGAAMNAHGRFALAAAAPALENLGTIAVLAATAVLFPGLGGLEQAPTSALLLLGLGTTAAVGLHAGCQWYGAWRAGVRLRPRAGWRDPEVRRVLRRAVPSLAQAALAGVQLLILLILANRVPGGVVAFQLAMNFYFLPIALAATPVALALAPRLARLHAAGDRPALRDAFTHGLVFALFLAVPAAAGYLALRGPIADAVSYGGFSGAAGTALIAAALGALAFGVVGETVFLVATYACYAREDTRTPMRAMLVQLAVCVSVAATAPALSGPAVLAVLGAAQSAGALAGAAVLVRALLRAVGPGREPLLRPLLRIGAVAVLMAVPAAFVGGLLPGVAGVLAGGIAGITIYSGAQAVLGAPELDWVTESVRSKIGRRRPRAARSGAGFPGDLALLAVAAVLGGLVGLDPRIALLAVAVLGVGAWVYLRPAVAAYLLVFLTPLTAGIDRGTLLPVLRPNEALTVLVGAALVVRGLAGLRTGEVRFPRLTSIDWSLIGLAVFTSVVPLTMMMARGREIIADDLQYAIVLWKYLVVYAIVRFSVRTERQALRCVGLSIAAACVVCVIGILQSLDLFGVPKLLGLLYAPFGVERTLAIGRGSSTLALAAAVADLAILNVALAVGLLLHRGRHRMLLGGAILICVFGALGAGEFSTVMGLLVAMVTLVAVSRAYRLIGYAVPLLLLGGVVMWPVLATRLAGFQSASGIPESWIVRLRNLNTYFLPEIGAHTNWLFGVRPSARVPASHEEFGWVWIESGYVWLLWGGGIPLLVAYLCFVVVCLRRGVAAARRAQGIVATIGLAVASVVAANVFLMLFDPHLTYRGAADALLVLLALLRNLGDDPPTRPERLTT